MEIYLKIEIMSSLYKKNMITRIIYKKIYITGIKTRDFTPYP